jgi:uncharacterized protein YxjI
MCDEGRGSAFRDRDSRFDRDKFVVREKTGTLVQKYHICDENEVPLLYVERPLLKLRGQAEVFDDDTKAVKRLTLREEKAIAIRERYTLLDPAEQLICTYERDILRMLVRSTWRVWDPFDQEIARAREPSLGTSLLRRVAIFGPFMCGRFDIALPDGTRLGGFRRMSKLHDSYELDLSEDPTRRLDRRIAVGLAILLDAMERV